MTHPFEFGRKLIVTGDIDPVYTIIWNCPEVVPVLKRYLLAYWCFYHMGTAAWISSPESEDGFWTRMMLAAESKEYPRCPERRHFRGANAMKSVAYLANRGVDDLFDGFEDGMTCREAMRECQTWVQFGPWIAFKVADMLERLKLVRIAFSPADVYLFDSPKEGAERLYTVLGETIPIGTSLQTWAVERLTTELQDLPAPPRFERRVSVQEVETVLCKWKSHLNGHYTLGEDIESCQKCLQRFGRAKLSRSLLKAGRTSGLW